MPKNFGPGNRVLSLASGSFSATCTISRCLGIHFAGLRSPALALLAGNAISKETSLPVNSLSPNRLKEITSFTTDLSYSVSRRHLFHKTEQPKDKEFSKQFYPST